MKTNKADANKLGYVGKLSGEKRDSDSWYTPLIYIEKARRVMGSIDIDPFTSIEANKVVKAETFYTIENKAPKNWNPASNRGIDGKNVWINPPYGRGVFDSSVKLFLENYKAGLRIKSAIMLVNNVTETRSGQSLLDAATLVCFPSKRISFENIDGKSKSGNTRGQMFLLFTDINNKDIIDNFRKEFEDVGVILSCQ